MSSNTKIIVLKSKELIYTGIFIILGILLILLMFYMFSPDKKDEEEGASDTGSEQVSPTMASYKPGVYTTNINLGGSTLEVSVTVDETTISHVDITNLDDTVTAMYPLIQPSLDEINTKLPTVSNIDDITYSSDNKYTSIVILQAIKQAIEPAISQ
ncbi:MAG: hypothetical protein ACI4D8_07150 [Wujia sp.]